MLKWLRSWFAWRFSLTRLVIAVLFLGTFVGLNLRVVGPIEWPDNLCPSILWGWPLPIVWERDESFYAQREGRHDRLSEDALAARRDNARSYRFPFTHQAYRLLKWETALVYADVLFPDSDHFALYAIIDGLFALLVLSLILFLQLPRHKLAAKVE